MSDFSTAFTVKATPARVFAAINDVRGWWTGEVEGVTDRPGAEFSYRHGDLHYSRQKIAEMTPDKRVAWKVTDAKLTFVAAQIEWVGSEIVFEIIPKGEETDLRFTHVGLTPACECYEGCSRGWTYFVDGSLRRFIETGHGAAALG